MKTLFNLTTSACDLDRFRSRDALAAFMRGFDGVELLVCEEDERCIVPEERVIGVHMSYFPYWLDFWRGDEAALMKEFGTLEACERYYGGTDKSALLTRFRADLTAAERYRAEYVVFHVSDASIEESFTGRYRHTNKEVIDASCELLNELFSGARYRPALLLENLWQPGLTFDEPAITRRLLADVAYKNKGFMLDTGHLLHMNETIRTQREGLAYIHAMLDAHGTLCGQIRGVHLHQSITGEYCRAVRQNPPALKTTYEEREWQMLEHALRTDLHRPFTCPGVRGLIDRISPEYLTFEFITENREQHGAFLREQNKALANEPVFPNADLLEP